jgi:hypothetical protein
MEAAAAEGEVMPINAQGPSVADLRRTIDEHRVYIAQLEELAGVGKRWEIVNRSTGECAQMSVYSTQAQALRTLVDYWRRDRLGKRPDIHEELPHLDVREMRPETCTKLHR